MNFNYDAHSKWVIADGDKTHRLNYDLNSNSVVVDAGGYHGEWSESIYNLYNSNIFILEPIKIYYENILNKFSSNDKVKVLNYGLSESDRDIEINLDRDSSSIYKPGIGTETIKVLTIDKFLNQNNISKIDLIKINIEGAEYELLEDIISKGIHNKIDNIQVQFHVFINDCETRRNKIREMLSETHECTYNYDFIWENWRKK